MKPSLVVTVSAALLLAACSKAPEPAAVPEPPDAAANMPMPGGETLPAPSKPPAQSGQVAAATGTVDAIDAAAGKITLTHGPVDSIGWPGMTMGFKATPEQIATVKVGQRVQFEFQAQGMDATITSIAAQP